jgi:hypothetical protein
MCECESGLVFKLRGFESEMRVLAASNDVYLIAIMIVAFDQALNFCLHPQGAIQDGWVSVRGSLEGSTKESSHDELLGGFGHRQVSITFRKSQKIFTIV